VPELKQKYDASTVALMRQALNEIITDAASLPVSELSLPRRGKAPMPRRKALANQTSAGGLAASHLNEGIAAPIPTDGL
jgi:hypothetical protein